MVERADLGLLRHVLDRGLGQPPAGDAGVGRLEDPLAGGEATIGPETPSGLEQRPQPHGQPGPIPHPPHRQQDARHERVAVEGVVPDGQRLARRAEDDLLVRDQAREPYRVDADVERGRARLGRCPGAPGWSGRRANGPAPEPPAGPPRCLSAVCSAVPDGASTLPSWCSSMISTPSMSGAASSQKRMSSTAPRAKLGAITALAGRARTAPPPGSSRLGGIPLVPTTACTPCAAYHSRRSPMPAAVVKSTATSVPAAASDVHAAGRPPGQATAPREDREVLAGRTPGRPRRRARGRRPPARPHSVVRPMRPAAPTTPTRSIGANPTGPGAPRPGPAAMARPPRTRGPSARRSGRPERRRSRSSCSGSA